MITILGAAGNVGGQIADILITKDEKARLVARSVERLRSRVGRRSQAMAGDARDTEFLVQAFSGSSAVFTLIPPNGSAGDFLAYADEIGNSIARALEIAGISYVVNLSSIGAELETGTGPIVGLHRQEQRLNRIPGLNVLHIRAASFMENLFMSMDMIRSRGMNGGALKGDLKMPMIATQDVASFAADRLVKRDFTGHTVQYLLGKGDLSMNEATMTIGIKIGKPNLQYREFPYDEAEKGLIAAGFSRDVSSKYVEMSKAMNEGLVKARRSPGTTTNTSFEEFCRSRLVPLFMQKKAA